MLEIEGISLCVIIPVHNESMETIEKGITHYSKFNIPVHIIDSSKDSTLFPIDRRIYYHYLPDYSFLNKIKFVVDSLSNKFVLLSPIDDLCCLEKIFNKYQQKIDKGNFAYLGGEYSMLSPSGLECNQIVYNEVFKVKTLNTKSLFINYRFPLFWGLYSTEVIARLLKIVTKYYFKNDNFIELSFVAVLPKLGAVYETEETFFYRTSRENSWGRRNKTQTLIDLIFYTKDQKTYLHLLRDNKITLIDLNSYLIYLARNTFTYGLLVGILKRFLNRFFWTKL